MRSPWIECFHPNPQARLRLFCFPYAGGSAAIFRLWHKHLPPDVEVCPVELPGRGGRFKEKPFDRLDPLLEALQEVFVPLCGEKPFAFFGHSLGALIGFELSRWLRRTENLHPSLLCISAYGPPRRLSPDRFRYHDAPEGRFLDKMKKMNGTPVEVLQNPEVMALFLPILRADLAIADFYEYVDEAPLDCPIFAIGGENDEEVNPSLVSEWGRETAADFRWKLFRGNHFFLHSASEEVLKELSRSLSRIVGEEG